MISLGLDKFTNRADYKELTTHIPQPLANHLRLQTLPRLQARKNAVIPCLFDCFRLYWLNMERAEIKHIDDYLGDLEEGLDLWVYQGPPVQASVSSKSWL